MTFVITMRDILLGVFLALGLLLWGYLYIYSTVGRWATNRKAQRLERARINFVNAVDLATFEGVSESDIAHLAEVSPATIRRWHSGESTPHPAIFPMLTKRITALADEHSRTKARKLKP